MGSTNYVSLSQAVALQRSLDVSAHNLANTNTAGFKAARPMFASLVDESNGNGPVDSVNYVQDKGDIIDQSQGALAQSGNPLDVALSGEGWFSYETATGQTAFGRDGRLAIGVDGDLVTLTGARILDAGGSPISLPFEVGSQFSIGDDGTISSVDGEILGQIGVFQPPDKSKMTAIGGGLYMSGAGRAGELVETGQFKIAQGFIEQSNVQPVLEMTRMMEIQRSYERSVNLMNDENDLTKQAIQRLGRIV
jgi:flagellar basal-body rod protein FlgF